ncbi:MAG: site-specific DNA-methyltransferase [Melioribacteraceae bacterium]|nr:site-specific DNA-methyltransferase [Melioribacteraceae bacterium]
MNRFKQGQRLNNPMGKKLGSRNQTILLSRQDKIDFAADLLKLNCDVLIDDIALKTIHGDIFKVAKYLPEKSVDLLFIDPPYNLRKSFNTIVFAQKTINEYSKWIEKLIISIRHILKDDATIYFCGDWRSSISIQKVLEQFFIIRNRITWEREKGRGSSRNWKNNTEDIWFCTVSDKYKFYPDRVKLKRKVLAPYKDSEGEPKDWQKSSNGSFRLTHSSNIWTDLSIPFWSMTENTNHPTQKPEKLIAKIILASSDAGDFVFDPFLGSGTTSVTAKKLNRIYSGVELDKDFCCITEKRLKLADDNQSIQGYQYGFFWERNTKPVMD